MLFLAMRGEQIQKIGKQFFFAAQCGGMQTFFVYPDKYLPNPSGTDAMPY